MHLVSKTKFLILSLTLVAHLCHANSFCSKLDQSLSGELLSKSDFLDKDGGKVNVKSWRGKIVLLHFWAPWSTDCIHDIRILNSFAKFLVEKEESGFAIVPVVLTGSSGNLENAQMAAKEFYDIRKIDALDLHFDLTNRYYNELQVDSSNLSLPFTILVDAYGREVGRAGHELISSIMLNSSFIKDVKHCAEGRASGDRELAIEPQVAREPAID